MRILLAVQYLFTAALLLLAIVTMFGIGITGLIFLVAAAAFAALASMAATRSRAAVAVVLAVNGAIALVAATKLLERLGQYSAAAAAKAPIAPHLVPSTADLLVPSAVVGLVVVAFVAVGLDWRGVRQARWF